MGLLAFLQHDFCDNFECVSTVSKFVLHVCATDCKICHLYVVCSVLSLLSVYVFFVRGQISRQQCSRLA